MTWGFVVVRQGFPFRDGRRTLRTPYFWNQVANHLRIFSELRNFGIVFATLHHCFTKEQHSRSDESHHEKESSDRLGFARIRPARIDPTGSNRF